MRERTRQLGAKEMATRREVRCEIHRSQEKSRFQKNHVRIGVGKFLRMASSLREGVEDKPWTFRPKRG